MVEETTKNQTIVGKTVGDFYVMYLDLSGMNPAKKAETIARMENVLSNQIKKPGERWLILPADRTEIVCINPIVLDGKEASAFIETFHEMRTKIYKELGI